MKKIVVLFCLSAVVFLVLATVFMLILSVDISIGYARHLPKAPITGATVGIDQFLLAILMVFASVFGAWAYWFTLKDNQIKSKL